MSLIGFEVGPDPELYPNYNGPRYNVYNITVEVKEDAFKKMKCYFDSKTNLLHHVKYYDWTVEPRVLIENRYSVWGNIDGASYPALFEHFEDGTLKYSFAATQITSSSSIDISNFQ